jgi:branched-chain amino acid transport system permease protein
VSAVPAQRSSGLESLRARWGRLGYVLLAVAYLVASFGLARGSLYLQGLLLVAACFAICALSLDLAAGSAGLYSLGQAGLFAVGAYLTTIINAHLGWNVFVLLPLSIVAAGICGLVLGTLSLRVSGLYFAICTFVFTLVVGVLASDLTITGGYAGLASPPFPNFAKSLSWLGSSLTWAVMLALLLTIVITWSIRKSPMHPVLLAIRDAEPFAGAAGVRTPLVKVGVFALSAGLTGMAGWAFAFLGFVSPGQFSWQVSVNILVMVIIGGMNTFLGPIIGAAFVSIFPAYVNMNPLWQEVLFGAIFVLVIVLFPQGFMGLVSMVARRLPFTSAGPGAPVKARERALGPLGEVKASSMSPGNGEAGPGREHRPLPDAVICRGVSFRYERGPAVLRDVELSVRTGSIHGLIGPNGSGKSTLVNLISGQLRPESGTIEVNGRRVDQLPSSQRARHGFMRTFQSATLVSELSCRDNVSVGYYSRVPGIAAKAPLWPFLPGTRSDYNLIRRQATDSLSAAGAADWAPVRVADVPHGVEQLTQLAAACIAGPATVILDEPLAGLSAAEVDHVGDILQSLQSAGVTIILIEHQVRFVFSLCEDVTVLSAGEVVASGRASAVREDPRVREVYLGM